MDLFNDNVRVRSTKWGGEFLRVAFSEPDEFCRDDVSICRYVVPGRFDIYTFEHLPSPGAGCGERIGFASERDTPITRLLPMLLRDLDRPQVVDLVKQACARLNDARLLARFLAQLAPASKSAKAATRAAETLLAKHKEMWRARRAAEKVGAATEGR